MNFKIKYVLSFIFILTCSVLSQEKQTEIDTLYKICIDNNPSTQGVIHCAGIAEEAWDKEMNQYYNLLMDVLKEDEKIKLKDSQLKWVAFRDSEFDFSGTMYYNLGGTMWLVANADKRVDIVKARALELKDYYTNLTEGE
jgi:uncharacterized protein YecT (DUF1311 family)